jgi:hypothetical protein
MKGRLKSSQAMSLRYRENRHRSPMARCLVMESMACSAEFSSRSCSYSNLATALQDMHCATPRGRKDMDLEWQVLILCVASLFLKMIVNGNRAKAVGTDDGPRLPGRSAEDGPRTIEQGLGEKR